MHGRYKVQPTKRVSLAKSLTAYYQEMSILNSCGSTLIAVDARNNRYSIPPIQHAAYNMGNSVTLSRRQIIGESKKTSGDDVIMEGICVTVDYYEIKQSPVYVEEFDLLLCMPEDVEDYPHPYQQSSYENNLAIGLEKIAETLDNAPMFKVLANDPTNNFDQLFTLINNRVSKIPVTHMAGDDFELTLIIVVNGKIQKEVINLNEFITGKENTYEFENRVIPFVTTSEVAANEMGKAFRWITMSVLNESLSKKDIEHKNELELQAKAFNAKITELTASITSLKSSIAQLKTEKDDIEFKYNSIKADLGASNDMMKHQTEREKYKAGQHISDNDVQISDTKADTAEKDNQLKTWHLVAAAAPAVALLIVEIIRALKK